MRTRGDHGVPRARGQQPGRRLDGVRQAFDLAAKDGGRFGLVDHQPVHAVGDDGGRLGWGWGEVEDAAGGRDARASAALIAGTGISAQMTRTSPGLLAAAATSPAPTSWLAPGATVMRFSPAGSTEIMASPVGTPVTRPHVAGIHVFFPEGGQQLPAEVVIADAAQPCARRRRAWPPPPPGWRPSRPA